LQREKRHGELLLGELSGVFPSSCSFRQETRKSPEKYTADILPHFPKPDNTSGNFVPTPE
jgi:hypothetical protein